MNPMKLKQLPSCVKQVETWQRYLKSRGMYSGSINGRSDDTDTVTATEKYQKQTRAKGDDIFCLSLERPDKDHFTKQHSWVDLTSSIQAVLRPLAYGYYLLTNKDLVVTSGRRSAEKQAQAMYDKAKQSESNLDVYKHRDLLRPIKAAYESTREAGEQAAVQAMTAVISAQVNGGKYISKHLSGLAFDVSVSGMGYCDKQSFEAVIKAVLGSVNGHLLEHEPGREKHFHVQFDR